MNSDNKKRRSTFTDTNIGLPGKIGRVEYVHDTFTHLWTQTISIGLIIFYYNLFYH
jgi:hypothetical protein